MDRKKGLPKGGPFFAFVAEAINMWSFMELPKRIPLFHDPSGQYVEEHVTKLSNELIEEKIERVWWSEPALDAKAASREIDRNWNWREMEIEQGGRILGASTLGVITGDGEVQGAMLLSNEPVACESDAGRSALFVELLFAAPRNRKWLHLDRKELYKGVGLAL